MKKYKIEITETLQKQIEVMASSKEEALDLIKQQYQNEDIVLTADDHVNTSIEVLSYHRKRDARER